MDAQTVTISLQATIVKDKQTYHLKIHVQQGGYYINLRPKQFEDLKHILYNTETPQPKLPFE